MIKKIIMLFKRIFCKKIAVDLSNGEDMTCKTNYIIHDGEIHILSCEYFPPIKPQKTHDIDACVCCGNYVPEGRQVCQNCELEFDKD